MAMSVSTVVTETISRLSAKSGVLATLAIDRPSSTLLSFKGSLGFLLSQTPGSNAPTVAGRTNSTTTASGIASSQPADSATGSAAEDDKINEFVQMIWKYVNGTEQMINGMDDEDDLKLLRLRTKKHELVIVPDSKFIFVVVHDVKSS